MDRGAAARGHGRAERGVLLGWAGSRLAVEESQVKAWWATKDRAGMRKEGK
jgi:hypothetical protein